MTGPSTHLSWAELACRDGTPYPEAWRSTRAVVLAAEFEWIRAAVNEPIVVASAYRTPRYNRRVGGAKHSQHVDGRALDLLPPERWPLGRFYELIHTRAHDPASKIYGLGLYPTFVHIDVRQPPPHDKLTVWAGQRAWPEVKKEVVT